MKNIATIKYNCKESGTPLITKVFKKNNIATISPYFTKLKRNQLKVNNEILNLISFSQEMSSNSFQVLLKLELECTGPINIYPKNLYKFEYMQDDDSIITFEGTVINVYFRKYREFCMNVYITNQTINY